MGADEETTDGQSGSGTEMSFFRKHRSKILLATVLAVGAAVGIGLWLGSRPEDLPVIGTSAEETLPTISKVAPFSDSSSVLLQFTTPLNAGAEEDAKNYYVRIEGIDDIVALSSNPTSLSLYLSPETAATIDSLQDGSSFVVENVTAADFPYRLDDEFDAESIAEAYFVEEVGSAIVASSVFEAVTTDSLPPRFTTTLQSHPNYNVAGTITIDYIPTTSDSGITIRPILSFDLPEATRAPGPLLYLSKRPYSETGFGNIHSEDLIIRLDESSDGSFTVQGEFQQFLDELGTDEEALASIESFANGSWIVWCEPFGVWLGGGQITAQG